MKKEGFTLIEMILVLAIFVIMVGVSTTAIAGALNKNQLSDSGNHLLQALRKAEFNSIYRVQDSEWGVYFSNEESKDYFIMFKGKDYKNRNPLFDQKYSLPGTLEFQHLALGKNLNQIVFSKVTGETVDFGQLELVDTSAPQNNLIFLINSLGQIEIK